MERVEKWLGSFSSSLVWKPQKAKRYRYAAPKQKFPKPHSYWSISTEFSPSVQLSLRDDAFPTKCIPEASVLAHGCKCGAGWEEEDVLLCEGLLFTSRRIIKCQVFARWCLKRTCRAHFDGSSVGIFNYSSKRMVAYDVLRDYAHSALASGMTFAGFVAKKNRELSTVFGESGKFLSRGSLVKMFTSYTEKRQKSSLPPCDLCGQYPPVLIADATDLGMPLKFLEPTYREVLPDDAPPSNNVVVPFTGRILVVKAEVRAKLLQFVNGEPKMARTVWVNMIKALRSTNKSIVAVLEHLYLIQLEKEDLEHFHFAGEWTEIL